MWKFGSLLSIALSFVCSLAVAKPVVRITSGEWAPYASETIENKGLLSQIAQEAFATQNVKVLIAFFPWARSTELSKTGEWDATLAFTKTNAREAFYLFSDSVYTGHYVFFHRKERIFEWKNYNDLKKFTMASTRGFGGMGQEFLTAEEKGVIKVLRNTNDIQSFMMLQADRVELVPSDLEVGYVLLQNIFGDKVHNQFTHNSKEIYISDYHLAVSKKAKDPQKIVEDFNRGLALLRKNGRYEEILKEWYGKPLYKALPRSPLVLKK